MICDTIENAASYANLSSHIASALGFLSRTDLDLLPVGRQDLEPNGALFALIQEYKTKRPDETFWETHRKYIDVQCVQNGAEMMGWAPIQSMKMKKPYDGDKDIIVWEGHGQQIELTKGRFVIFMPHDAHMGGLLIEQPLLVRKIVVKVAVD